MDKLWILLRWIARAGRSTLHWEGKNMPTKKKTATPPRKGPKAPDRRGPRRSPEPVATERPKAEFLPGQNYAFGAPKSYED